MAVENRRRRDVKIGYAVVGTAFHSGVLLTELESPVFRNRRSAVKLAEKMGRWKYVSVELRAREVRRA